MRTKFKCKVSYGAGNKQRTRTKSVKWIIVTSVVFFALEKMRSSGKLLLLALTFEPYQRVYGIWFRNMTWISIQCLNDWRYWLFPLRWVPLVCLQSVSKPKASLYSLCCKLFIVASPFHSAQAWNVVCFRFRYSVSVFVIRLVKAGSMSLSNRSIIRSRSWCLGLKTIGIASSCACSCVQIPLTFSRILKGAFAFPGVSRWSSFLLWVWLTFGVSHSIPPYPIVVNGYWKGVP